MRATCDSEMNEHLRGKEEDGDGRFAMRIRQ